MVGSWLGLIPWWGRVIGVVIVVMVILDQLPDTDVGRVYSALQLSHKKTHFFNTFGIHRDLKSSIRKWHAEPFLAIAEASGKHMLGVFKYALPLVADLIQEYGFSRPDLLIEKLQKEGDTVGLEDGSYGGPYQTGDATESLKSLRKLLGDKDFSKL